MSNVLRLAIVDPSDATREELKSMLLGMDMVWLEAECSRYEFFADVVGQTHPDIGEYGHHEMLFSFEAEAKIVSAEHVVVKFNFKRVTEEKMAGKQEEGDEEHAEGFKLEVSSELLLSPAVPRIVNAKSDGQVATFLVMNADI